MKKLVAAGMISLAVVAMATGPIQASPLSALFSGSKPAQQAKQKDVVLAQAMDPRVGQLEEEIRSLNGRIEEMSYQLLQMQETIRKAQEDNEYRFQEIEGGKAGGAAKGKRSEAAPADGGMGQSDVATNTGPAGDTAGTDTLGSNDIGGSTDTASANNGGLAAGEQQLGSIEFDQNGNPVSAERNPDLNNQSASINQGNALPGVEDGLPAASETATASLDNPDDLYNVAYGHVLSGDYQQAEREFRDYLDIHPKGDKAADANFWMGEAQYSQGNFNEAAKTFLNAHQTFAKSKKAPEMLLKLGMSLAQLDNRDTACATLREVDKRYPNASKAVKNKVVSERSRLSC